MQLYDAITRRRDVRAEFTGEPLDDEVLNRVLAAAHSAPSVGHSQPWDFILVEAQSTRRAFQEHVAAEREVFASQLSTAVSCASSSAELAAPGTRSR